MRSLKPGKLKTLPMRRWTPWSQVQGHSRALPSRASVILMKRNQALIPSYLSTWKDRSCSLLNPQAARPRLSHSPRIPDLIRRGSLRFLDGSKPSVRRTLVKKMRRQSVFKYKLNRVSPSGMVCLRDVTPRPVLSSSSASGRVAQVRATLVLLGFFGPQSARPRTSWIFCDGISCVVDCVIFALRLIPSFFSTLDYHGSKLELGIRFRGGLRHCVQQHTWKEVCTEKAYWFSLIVLTASFLNQKLPDEWETGPPEEPHLFHLNISFCCVFNLARSLEDDKKGSTGGSFSLYPQMWEMKDGH